MKKILPIIIAALLLSSYADINTTNQLIAESNERRLVAYGNAMVACGDDDGCKVGVSMAYGSGIL